MRNVYLTAGDRAHWALDTDLAAVKRALSGIVRFTNLREADLTYSVWWRRIPNSRKPAICQLSSDLDWCTKMKSFSRVLASGKVSVWIAQTTLNSEKGKRQGIKTFYIPYTIDTGIFCPIQDTAVKPRFMKSWNIPTGKYLIGNFHWDSVGSNLLTPKKVKGPDIFCAIVDRLIKSGLPIHVILAGPRRHYMRAMLQKMKVPFTFIGKVTSRDDYPRNIHSHRIMNVLYNILDLYIISSRLEGGPRSVIESAAAGCPVISTFVGLSMDVLDKISMYSSVEKAVNMVSEDIESGSLRKHTGTYRERVMRYHTASSVKPKFMELLKLV